MFNRSLEPTPRRTTRSVGSLPDQPEKPFALPSLRSRAVSSSPDGARGYARLDIEIKNRFGRLAIPRKWFLVPLFVVDEAAERIRDGTITGYAYDPKTASLSPSDG